MPTVFSRPAVRKDTLKTKGKLLKTPALKSGCETDGQPPKKNGQLKSIWYASDCSGLDVGALSLKRAGVKFRHWFASESDKGCRDVLHKIHDNVEVIFHDCRTKDLRRLKQERSQNPGVKLIYTSGFSCQPYSKAGSQQGEHDPRAGVVWSVIDTISALLPTVYILENVADLAASGRYASVFQKIMQKLENVGRGAYHIEWKIMDSFEFGAVPAKRNRVYVVGCLKCCMTGAWTWPGPIQPPSLDSILQPRKKDEKADIASLSKTNLRNIAEGIRKIQEQSESGASWKKQPWVIDCANSATFGLRLSYNSFPTITKSHANSLWLVHKEDFANETELLAGQGIKWSDLGVRAGSLPANKIGQMVGNSFTLTIFVRLYQQIFPCLKIRMAKSK